MIIAGAVGVVLLAVIIFVFTRGGDGDPAEATADANTPTLSGSVTVWYEGTAALRGEVANYATAVRAFVEAEDGIQLQPNCTSLAEQAALAVAYEPAPDVEVQKLWSDGATGFADAAATCGTLWTLPAAAPETILADVTAELDTAEEAWADLDGLVAEGLPDLPSGTLGTFRPRTPTPSATPSAPVVATPVAPTETTPGALPSIDIGDVFGTPTPTPSAPATPAAETP